MTKRDEPCSRDAHHHQRPLCRLITLMGALLRPRRRENFSAEIACLDEATHEPASDAASSRNHL